MKYAHIYKAPAASGFKWKLIITDHNDLSIAQTLATEWNDSKVVLKQIAKATGAQAWNY